MAGYLVLYPVDFRKPTEAQRQAFIELLLREEILASQPREVTPTRTLYESGPAFDRLGLPSRSRPMLISLQTLEPSEFDADDLDEEWELLVVKSHLIITVQDAGPPELVEQTDPIWQQIAEALGSELAVTYHHS